MGFKSFLKEWKPKKMEKEELVELLTTELADIEGFYFAKGYKERELVEKFFNKMATPKFAKTLKKVMKEQELDYGVATIIADFLEKKGSELPEELIGLYTDIVDKILKGRVKKLAKKVGIEADIAKDILVVVPGEDYIQDKFVGIYVGRVTRKLYALARETALELNDTKQLKKLFKFLFKEELINDVAVAILLERKEIMKNFNEKQVEIWNLLTAFALDTLNGLEKAEIKEYIGKYIERRMKEFEKGRDSARRVQLSQIADEDFGRLLKVVKKFQEKEKFSKFL